VSDFALGVRVKSGWGAAVLLGGTRELPTLLESRRLTLADPGTPASVQPYHDGAGTPRTNRRELDRLLDLVRRSSERNLAELLATWRSAGRLPGKAVVVASSDVDPETLTNPHIRIHALEGRLFRDVTRKALIRLGIPCVLQLERELLARAPAAWQRTLKDLGRDAEGPWRAEQKSAALAAWELLR